MPDSNVQTKLQNSYAKELVLQPATEIDTQTDPAGDANVGFPKNQYKEKGEQDGFTGFNFLLRRSGTGENESKRKRQERKQEVQDS